MLKQWLIQDFPAPTSKMEVRTYYFGQMFPKDRIEMKKKGLRGAHASLAYPGFANVKVFIMNYVVKFFGLIMCRDG